MVGQKQREAPAGTVTTKQAERQGRGIVGAPQLGDTIERIDSAVAESQKAPAKKKGRYVWSCCGKVWVDD